jgi:hypothetical protein
MVREISSSSEGRGTLLYGRGEGRGLGIMTKDKSLVEIEIHLNEMEIELIWLSGVELRVELRGTPLEGSNVIVSWSTLR